MSESLELTTQEKNIYNYYLSTLRRGEGYTPRRDFNNFSSEKTVLLKKISKIIREKNISPKMFFDAPFYVWGEKQTNLQFYSTFKAISAYKTYISSIELTEPDHEHNCIALKNSFKHIYDVCNEHKIMNVRDYMLLQSGIYPRFILDLKKRDITYYTIIALDNQNDSSVVSKINIDKKTVEFVCKDFYNNLNSLRSRFVFSKKIKPLSIKLIKTINNILKIK